MYIIAFELFALIVLSYYLFHRDIFAVSVLQYLGYFVCALFGIYNKLYWDIDISSQLVFILTLGWIGIFLGEFFISCVLYRGINVGRSESKTRIQYIEIGTPFLLFLIILNIIITILMWRETVSISGGINLSLAETINASKTSDESLSSMMVQLVKITKGSSYVCIFVFINNFIASKIDHDATKKSSILLLIPGILYCVQSLFRGQRYTIIAFFLGAIFCYYIMAQETDGWKKGISLKTLIRVGILAIVVVYAFWALREVFGRESEAGLMEYISRYLGGSYELFDLYLDSPEQKAYETFAYLLKSFSKLGLSGIPIRDYHEFRFSNTGVLIGNTYTAMRNYFNDFGYFGVFFLCMIKSMIFSGAYYKIKQEGVAKNKFLSILYMSLVYSLLFDFFTDYFFARLSIGYFIEVFIMYVLYILICKKSVRIMCGKVQIN